MKTIFLFALLFVGNDHKHDYLDFKPQLTAKDITAAKEFTKTFYEKIFKDSAQLFQDSSVIASLKTTIKDDVNTHPSNTIMQTYYSAPMFTFHMITQGLSKDVIMNKIDQMTFHDLHNLTYAYGCLVLNDQKTLVFPFEYEAEMEFNYIYLPDGNNLNAAISAESKYLEYITFPGSLNSNIKSISIYKKADEKSGSIGNILQNELFYYSPISKGEWVAVYKKYLDDKIVGYIKKKNIAPFEKMPEKNKKIYFKNFGC